MPAGMGMVPLPFFAWRDSELDAYATFYGGEIQHIAYLQLLICQTMSSAQLCSTLPTSAKASYTSLCN